MTPLMSGRVLGLLAGLALAPACNSTPPSGTPAAPQPAVPANGTRVSSALATSIASQSYLPSPAATAATDAATRKPSHADIGARTANFGQVVGAGNDITRGASPAALGVPARAAADRRRTMVVGGLGGFSFDARKGAALAISVGAHVTPAVRVTVEVGRLPDIMPARAMQAIRSSVSQFYSSLGDTVTSNGHLDATTVLGMVRLAPTGGARIMPFVDAAAGLAHVAGTLTFAITDPATGSSGTSSAIPGYALNQLVGLHAMVAGGMGVTIRLDQHLGLDLGYRYSRILTRAAVSANRAYANLHFGF